MDKIMGSTIVYSSGSLGHLAKYAAEETGAFIQLGLGTVVFGVAWVESFVNELLHDVRWSAAAPFHAEVMRLQAVAKAAGLGSTSTSLAVKIRTIATCLTGALPDEGTQPFQDFVLLVKLRNEIIHQRPERIDATAEPTAHGTKLLVRDRRVSERGLCAEVANLVSRGLFPPSDPTGMTPISLMLQSRQAARWAFQTARAMVIETSEWLPEEFQQMSAVGGMA